MNVAEAERVFNLVTVRDNATVNVADAESERALVVSFPIDAVNVLFAERVRYPCLMIETVNVAEAEIVFSFVTIRDNVTVKVALAEITF